MAYRLLIVDDSPSMRAFIRRVVQVSGFDCSACLEAANGEEALAILNREWVDLILTDVNMPAMDGVQFVRRLEQDKCLRSIPVLVISTDSSNSRIQHMLSMGVKGYLAKPFTPEDLRAEMERLLRISYARD